MAEILGAAARPGRTRSVLHRAGFFCGPDRGAPTSRSGVAGRWRACPADRAGCTGHRLRGVYGPGSAGLPLSGFRSTHVDGEERDRGGAGLELQWGFPLTEQSPMTTSAQRDGFTSTLGVLAATLGSAVGLGNIWKFPALTGANGGAGFLLVYLFATLLVGLPVMIAEITLGRRARANPIAALKGMAPGRPWWLVGVSGMVAAFMIMAFYSEVVAWVFAYVWKSLEGSALSSDAAVTEGAFAALVASPWQSLIWQWVVLLLIGGILLRGV